MSKYDYSLGGSHFKNSNCYFDSSNFEKGEKLVASAKEILSPQAYKKLFSSLVGENYNTRENLEQEVRDIEEVIRFLDLLHGGYKDIDKMITYSSNVDT